MKIIVTFEFDHRCRRALAMRLGEPGLASRKACQRWISSTVDADLSVIVSETVDADDNNPRAAQ